MATQLPSLFGTQMEPEQMAEARALQFAQMSPQQQMQYNIYRNVNRLGRGAASLLGADVQDPAMRKASQIRQLASQFDTNTPEGMMEFAGALRQIDPQLAMQAAQQAQAMVKTQAEIGATRALEQQRLRERQVADPINKLISEGKYTPESVATYRESGNIADLKLSEKATQRKTTVTTAGGRRILIDETTGETIKDLGSAGKTLEESLGEGLGALGKALAAGQKKEAEETATFAVKDFNTLGSAVAAGTASKRNIVVLETAMKNAFTGKFADVKEGVVTGLEGLGIKVGEDLRQAASNTQLINAMGTRYVFPLVKNFPGSLAAKELDRLEKTAPNSLQQPETIQTLLNLLKQDLAENEFTYNRAKQYKEANKGSVIGFNPADSKIEYQRKLTDLQNKVSAVRRAGTMTPAQRDEINALKKELGVE